MQHRIAITALGLLLAAVPAPAQTGTGTVARPGLDGGTPPGTMDSARQAEPGIGNTLGRDLQAYVLMLQAGQERPRAAQAAARAEPHSYSGGAMTPARQMLMQEARDAWRAMQRAPAAVERTEAYADAERAMRQAFGEIGPTRDLSGEEGLQAAERAQRALDGLGAEVARMAAATGSSVPAPPVAGGPQAPVAPRTAAIHERSVPRPCLSVRCRPAPAASRPGRRGRRPRPACAAA